MTGTTLPTLFLFETIGDRAQAARWASDKRVGARSEGSPLDNGTTTRRLT